MNFQLVFFFALVVNISIITILALAGVFPAIPTATTPSPTSLFPTPTPTSSPVVEFSIQGSPITTTDNSTETQASRISLSGDALTLVVSKSAESAQDLSDGAYVFFRPYIGAPWSPTVAFLQGNDTVGEAHILRESNRISRDGQTIVQCGYGDDTYIGACWVFTRTGNTSWEQQSLKLIGGGWAGQPQFGFTLPAISDNGNTIAIGAPMDNGDHGGVWIFVREGTSWEQQGFKLLASDASLSTFGISVGLSGDGNTLVVGGSDDDASAGAVWVFIRTGEDWEQQGLKITIGIPAGVFGANLAVRNDGLMFAASAGANLSVHVFQYVEGAWETVGDPIQPDGHSDVFADSIAFSLDGTYLAIGDRGLHNTLGGVFVFKWVTDEYVFLKEVHYDLESGTNNDQGISVALSSTGYSLAFGAPWFVGTYAHGAAFVFDSG